MFREAVGFAYGYTGKYVEIAKILPQAFWFQSHHLQLVMNNNLDDTKITFFSW